MPRSSSPSRSTPAVKPVAQRPVATVPAATPVPPTSSPHQYQHNVRVERLGFFTNVWQGFGLGAGQAIAHNIFRSSAEPTATAPSQPSVATNELPKEFTQCMKEHNNDIELCKQFIKT